MRYFIGSICLMLAGCSSAPPPVKQAATPPAGGPGPAATTSKHPLAKYIELAGFRMSESSAGKLKIKFAAINHSDADLGDLNVKVKIVTSAAKPEDPPVTQFEAKIPALGPQAITDVSAQGSTTLRIYELPDWQFLRAEFDITSPPPE